MIHLISAHSPSHRQWLNCAVSLSGGDAVVFLAEGVNYLQEDDFLAALAAPIKLGVSFFVLQTDLDVRSLVVSWKNMVRSIEMDELADLIISHEKSASWF